MSEICPHAKDESTRFITICKVCELDGLVCYPECYKNYKDCPYNNGKWETKHLWQKFIS